MKHSSNTKKVLILGDPCVGKTAILNQFINREFSSLYKPTVGSDYLSKQVEIDDQFYTLQIWDTAGQEKFRSLAPTFYRGADCCCIVYDVTDERTFQNIDKWRDGFIEQVGTENLKYIPILLLGNKNDIPQKVIETSAAQKYADEKTNMLFAEVSAKTSDNIATAFNDLVRLAISQKPIEVVPVQGAINPDISLKRSEHKKSCC